MEGQMRISDTALDALVIQCNYRPGQGWDAVIQSRQNGQTWAGSERRLFEYLTTDELAQVLDDEILRILG